MIHTEEIETIDQELSDAGRGFLYLCLAVVCSWIVIGLLILAIPSKADAAQLTASWYSRKSLIDEGTWKNGKEQRMANGQRFRDDRMGCATRLYPLGTTVLVTDVRTGKSIRVVVCDRIGKRFAKTRIDLTPLAFSRLAKLETGVIPVTVEVVR